jgi:hypothetical protein
VVQELTCGSVVPPGGTTSEHRQDGSVAILQVGARAWPSRRAFDSPAGTTVLRHRR